jgi:hypothetical protein
MPVPTRHVRPALKPSSGPTTIEQMQEWVQPLAETRQVIAVEMRILVALAEEIG